MIRPTQILCLLLLTACDPLDADPTSLRNLSEIYGGDLDTENTAVGALVVYPSGALFCTGTLIDATHVLTAAHCVFDRIPSEIEFFTGDSQDDPLAGRRIAVSTIDVHPAFDSSLYINDVAVLTLAESVVDISPIALSRRSDEDALLGESAHYSGYGRTEHGTNGTRLHVDVPFFSIYPAMFSAIYDDQAGTGICFGDSGGPALHDFGNGLEIIGVNSTVLAFDPQSDPCIGTYNVTRIAPMLPFINNAIGSSIPSCLNLDTICLCDDACQPGGTCDNGLCRTENCAAGFDCLSGCPTSDGACANSCYIVATEEGLDQLSTFLECGNTHCGDASETDVMACLETFCPAETDTCFSEAACDSAMEDCDTDEGEDDLPHTVSGCQIAPNNASANRSMLSLFFF